MIRTTVNCDEWCRGGDGEQAAFAGMILSVLSVDMILFLLPQRRIGKIISFVF